MTQRRPPGRIRSQRGSKRHRIPALRLLLLGCVALLLWAVIARNTAPRANTSQQSFDAIIVLGVPADRDGNPTPLMLDRVNEGIREYEHGVAPRLLFTGGAAHNPFAEAETMARVAHARGVPSSAILEETHALDTIQNLCYSAQILTQRGLHSAEIVTSPEHLPRAAMIAASLSANLPQDQALKWRTHPAPDALTPASENTVANLVDVLKTARYLLWARWTESCPA